MFESLFLWLSDHIHILGWSTVIGFVTWLWKKSVQISIAFQDGRKRFETVEQNVNVATTNHLAHIESDMAEINGKHDKTTEVLQSIDRNIAVLVDRGRY